MTDSGYRYPQGKIIVFAKHPELGKVKTRLARAIGEAAALQFHEKMLWHTLKMARLSNLARVELHVSGNPDHQLFKALALQFNLTVHTQIGDDLGEKMFFALEESTGKGNYCVLIGTDCPVMDVDYLSMAFSALARAQDAVLGPAEDGGYVLIGTRKVNQSWFSNITWGSNQVLKQSRAKLQASGAKFEELPTLWDVDQVEDLQRWQAVSNL